MKTPFWRTLAWRLTLAFVLVGALTLGIVGAVSNAYTRSEFSSLLGAQAEEDLVNQVSAYVQRRGSLEGFRPAWPRRGAGDFPRRQGAGQPTDNPDYVYRGPYLVLDTQRRSLFRTPDLPRGAVFMGPRAGQIKPVNVNGRLVAYVASSGIAPRLDPRGAEFLTRTARAIGWAMLGAALAAVIMGLIVSRALLRPLRELLSGIHGMQRGESPRPLGHVPSDEFGEVLTAFHHMHSDVTRHQQAQRQLTANIAHDLNTPLAVISGTLEGILDGTFKPTPERLARLHHETQHVSSLVNDLRFLALADAGELQLNLRDTGGLRLVTQTVDRFREVAERQGVTLGLVGNAGEAPVKLDVTRVTQVLQNLLSNALAHTPAGGEVRVAVRALGAFSVSVTDTGAGIPQSKLPFVFDRLYRADEARAEGHSGLGLSICKSIVEAHGGWIAVQSEEGAGTTVTFELPGARAAGSS